MLQSCYDNQPLPVVTQVVLNRKSVKIEKIARIILQNLFLSEQRLWKEMLLFIVSKNTKFYILVRHWTFLYFLFNAE